MDTICCRTCLSIEICYDIADLTKNIDENKSCMEIMLFCLDIAVDTDPKISTKLCTKCFLKIVDVHNFKKQALINEQYLKTLVNNKVYVADHYSATNQYESKCDKEVYIEINSKGIDLKEEVNSEGFQSDDEFLSVLKSVKYNYGVEEVKKNVSTNQVKNHSPQNRKRSKSTKSPSYQCVECGKKVRNLKEHMILHQPSNTPNRFKCKYCDKSFLRYSARYRHVKFKHMGYKEHCSICNKDMHSLKSHNLIVHDANNLKYECEICKQKFISPSRLQEHQTVAHTREKPFPCDVCGKTFRTKQVMNFHKRQVHDKERSHLCQICSKSFFKKDHLLNHIRSHTKEKPYECNECGKRYVTNSSLKNHQMLHKASRDFACYHCDMTFTLKRYLNRHMTVHTKEKKYPCSYCGVRFFRSDHRNRHHRTAHEKTFT